MDFAEWIKTSWVYILAFGSGFAAILNLSKNIKALIEKLSEPEKKQDERIKQNEDFIKLLKDEREDYLKSMKHFYDHESISESNFVKINDALMSLIRDRINCFYFQKCSERGYITPIELEIVEDLYQAYKDMGGNGMITREMEIIRKLPVFESSAEYQKWKAEKIKKAENK